MTQIIKFPWSKKEKETIQEALYNGKTIAFPTETFYALGGNALSKKCVEQVFKIKKRPQHKPLLILVDPQEIDQLILPISSQTEQLIKEFWPGALTLILKARPDLPHFLMGPNQTVAVRYSNSQIVQKLISLGQCPLIGTSANLSDNSENEMAIDVYNQLGPVLDLVIDGGKTVGQKASTIVDTSTTPMSIVRPGAISSEALEPFLSS